jgi:hypothetical protein
MGDRDILHADVTDTDFPLVYTIDSGSGGVTGLSPTVRVRNGGTTNSYLDFNDDTFKTGGWTQQDASLTEIERGHYQYILDIDAIVGLAVGDSIVAEYNVAEAGATGDAHDQVILRTQPVALLADTAFPLVLTIDNNGGVTGQTPTVRVRKGNTTNQYLDFNDDTFKTSGWTQQDLNMTEVERGHYAAFLDINAMTLATGDVLVAEYRNTGDLDSDNHDIVLIESGTTPDTTPPVITNFVPANGSTVGQFDPLQFDVTDNSGLFAKILVAANLVHLGTKEVVYDGSFTPRYIDASSRDVITDGFRFKVQREEGWPLSPDGIQPEISLEIFVIDTAANVKEEP